ncbi:MAG: hypothetical protein J6S61_04855 [Elusimicrobiaceae bacterium]|nr:hypothetical protein [Elusimicrobiaceae bacterium]
MEEKIKKTRKKKEVKTKKAETLPIIAQQPGKALTAKKQERPKVLVRTVRQPRHQVSVAEILVSTFQKLIKKSLLLLIPWILLSTGILLTGSYIIFKEFFVGMAYPVWYLILVACLLFGIYGFIGFVYGFIMALLHTVLSVSSSLGESIRKTVLRIKNSLESKVDKFADNLEQNNLLQTIKSTFEDISQNIRKYAAKTVAGVLVIACLGGILFVIKNFMVKSFKKVQNKAEFFTKMSIRFSLLLAIILNLRLFAKIAIAIGYLVGILLILSQYLIWHIMR